MPGKETFARYMKTSNANFLPLVPEELQYYELYLGKGNKNSLRTILE